MEESHVSEMCWHETRHALFPALRNARERVAVVADILDISRSHCPARCASRSPPSHLYRLFTSGTLCQNLLTLQPQELRRSSLQSNPLSNDYVLTSGPFMMHEYTRRIYFCSWMISSCWTQVVSMFFGMGTLYGVAQLVFSAPQSELTKLGCG